ncbi:hypothetical protein LOK49_LG01G01693 [Camellia lanceoleosa]|uniref:Uncharacterized protein n=1 Tax=Camellia lanceoleosa TaxID=1840588 RepID=A0ACC0J6V0_9ERIC|nr:hypothetical protein LOK49_LG01G01693 [Camellia lanceoleosa]
MTITTFTMPATTTSVSQSLRRLISIYNQRTSDSNLGLPRLAFLRWREFVFGLGQTHAKGYGRTLKGMTGLDAKKQTAEVKDVLDLLRGNVAEIKTLKDMVTAISSKMNIPFPVASQVAPDSPLPPPPLPPPICNGGGGNGKGGNGD